MMESLGVAIKQGSLVRAGRLVLAVAMCTLALGLAEAPASADIRGDVRYDADFLRSLQLTSGAIVSDVRRSQVEPYVANYAAWGLARASRYTGDHVYLNSAVDWLSWYQDHMDSNGVVHDYVVVNGQPQATDDEDSVDATSGTFLLALKEAYLASSRWARPRLLERFSSGMRRAVGAIESLQDGDGLTWAKSSWHVKYLMDNAEAYGGLLAARDLTAAMGDRTLSAAALEGATRVKEGVRLLWNSERQAYDWAKHGDGYRQPTDWRMLYPDAVEQAWAVAFGLVDPPRSHDLMARFLQAQPNWDRPTAMATYWDGTPYAHRVGFWPVVGWAFGSVGDAARAAAGGAHIREGAWEINRQPPYTSGAQGALILLVTGGVPPGSLG